MVIGGLVASTLLDQIVTPAVFWKFGRKVYQPPPPGRAGKASGWDDAWLDGHAPREATVASPPKPPAPAANGTHEKSPPPFLAK